MDLGFKDKVVVCMSSASGFGKGIATAAASGQRGVQGGARSRGRLGGRSESLFTASLPRPEGRQGAAIK